MIRKISSVVIALLAMTGLGLASAGLGFAHSGTASPAPAAARAVIPNHGSYSGVDHHGRIVTFSFSGTDVSHFAVNHLVIGGAYVSRGMWHETCHGGICTRGAWVTDGHVTGFWRYGGDPSWTAWSASSTPAMTPYGGTYMGTDHTGLRVHLSFNGGYVRGFSIDHNVVGDAPVTNGSFEVCHRVICYQGHWENEYYVVGSWRHASGGTWRPWEAYAYAT
ncbi:MAG: hypothetical protein JWN22_1244 [Nocardioides sp.]|jgi:hypothetical protein|nr:hypothetical protein [Nocardioides sp.]